MTTRLLSLALFLFAILTTVFAADAIPPIPRVLPPEGLEIPADIRARLETRLAVTKKRLDGINDATLKPDIEVFTKAVELALLHREFYVERDFAKADWALDEADKRLDSLAANQSPWTKATGLVVEGYRSSIDGSAQPYGLVIPKDHDFNQPSPLYVWLHGRGDKNTDLHFLAERAARPGQIAPAGAIVVHPFGRHCVGWKHAGEIDVLEVVESVKQRYKIDPDRVVLIGFSMGGAGAWHIGAHYTDQWVAVSPGAGFVDTARYQKITPDRYPEWYVQKLWGLYDVPGYVRNLFNTNVIAYSGELDPQRQAAVFMEEAYKSEGRTLTHLIGPGVEHKYEPETLKQLLRRLDMIVTKDIEKLPREVDLQTKTLRYSKIAWLAMTGLHEHWQDARIDGEMLTPNSFKLTTKNVSSLRIEHPRLNDVVVEVDKQTVLVRSNAKDPGITLAHDGAQWRQQPPWYDKIPQPVRKVPGLQGPIDDAFMRSFIVVVPTGKSKYPGVQKWLDFELEHFKSRWRALMRSEPRVMMDVELDEGDRGKNWILWGDSESNSVWKGIQDHLPVKFDEQSWRLGEAKFARDRYVPCMIFPNPVNQERYVVLNSGLTFREGHDRTNSQQNPKLPDWAIIDITQPPDAFTPGRIHDADFFDEQWQLKRQPKVP